MSKQNKNKTDPIITINPKKIVTKKSSVGLTEKVAIKKVNTPLIELKKQPVASLIELQTQPVASLIELKTQPVASQPIFEEIKIVESKIYFNTPNVVPGSILPKRGLLNTKLDDSKRKMKDFRDDTSYQKLTQREQIFKRAEMYIGSIEITDQVEDVFNFETNKFETKTITMPSGIKHIAMEIFTNAVDNADATRRYDESVLPVSLRKKIKNVGKIQVWIDNKRIRVRNAGLPIPVIPSDKIGGNLIPVSIFGELNSSSNYDDGEFIRSGNSVNGQGSKISSIFSTLFRVKIGDPIRGQELEIIWTSNMGKIEYLNASPGYVNDGKQYTKDAEGNFIPADGKKYTGDPYVEIEYELDFARFGYTEYPEEALGLFAQCILFLGMSTKVIVSINDVDYDVRNIREFAKLKFDEETCKTSIIHYEWPTLKKGRSNESIKPQRFANMTQAQLEKAIINPMSSDEIPKIELLALDTPDNAVVLSMVNGQSTPEGGVHVVESFRGVTSSVLDEVNNTINNKKGKQKETKEAKIQQLTITSVTKHISLIVSCRLFDTKYTSQTKVKLAAPKTIINIDQKTLEKVKKWRLIERLYEEMQQKVNKAIKKTDGKKRTFLPPVKGEDANEAGGPKALQCVLYWAEGDSATAYPKARISASPGGKNFGGFFPGKGKMINICTATANQLINNDDIKRLKTYTGMFEGMDVTNPVDKKKMRYGLIMIATDADKDGQHILMLRINYIFRRFPSLISEGMVGYLETPFARALKGKNRQEKCLQIFRNEKQLEDWLEENSSWFTAGKEGHWIKYYKGLASSRDRDIKEDLTTAPVVVVLYDDLTERSLDIAFQKENTHLRKKWIEKWRDSTGIQNIVLEPISSLDSKNNMFTRTITSLCNINLVDYSKETYLRALPSVFDGLKESQRKSLYSALIKWSFGKGRAGSMKTGRISSYAAELTSYHYNESCLTATFTKQAQSFTGTNNMAYFLPEGQLGSRHQGGADAGEARYTEIDIAEWIKYVYYEDFLKVIPKRISEGSEIEPEWLPAVIPMHLVNGFKGIATAYSTFGPNHNPFDVIEWLKSRCNGNQTPEYVHPWYSDYNGVIEIANVDWSPTVEIPKKKSKRSIIQVLEEKEEDEDEEENEDEDICDDDEKAMRKASRNNRGGPSMITYGVFEQKGSNTRITELPIGTWTYNYRKDLEKMRDKCEISNVIDNSKVSTVDFTVKDYIGQPSCSAFKLSKSFTLANMVLIDREGYPTRYKNTQDILQKYFKLMIDMFTKLKNLRIKECEDALFDIDQRLLFIISHNDGKLVISKKSDEFVFQQLDELKIQHKYYDLIKARDFSEKKVAELQGQKDKLLEKLEVVKNTTPEQMWILLLEKLETNLKKLKICILPKNITAYRKVTNKKSISIRIN